MVIQNHPFPSIGDVYQVLFWSSVARDVADNYKEVEFMLE